MNITISRRDFLAQASALPLAAVCGRSSVASAAMLEKSRIGSNTAMPGYGLYQALDALHELGFANVEIHPFGALEPGGDRFPGFQFDRLPAAETDRLRKSLARFEHITTHLPFQELHLFSGNEPIAEFSIEQLKIAMDATAYFGAKIGVIHVTPPSYRTSLKEVWSIMVRRFREWGDIAAKTSFRLAIETGYPNSVRDFVRLVQEINHDHVGCTIDVGHQSGYEEFTARVKPSERATPAGIQAYNDVTHEIIDQLGNKVLHFHVHDINPKTWKDHSPLGSGVVDYLRLLRKLKGMNYQGLFVFELEATASQIRASLADGKRRLEKFLAETG